MPNEATLELSSLPARHPSVGEALLDSCAGPVIVRLSMEPTLQPPGTLSREVEVNWLRRDRAGAEEQVVRRIGWSNQEGRRKASEQLSIARNAEYLSEGAAIGVAALLIHDLEGGVLQNVLAIGSGGDYLLRVAGEDGFIQLVVRH